MSGKIKFILPNIYFTNLYSNLSGKLFQNDDMSPAVDRRENVTKPLPLPSGTLHRYDNVTYSWHISFTKNINDIFQTLLQTVCGRHIWASWWVVWRTRCRVLEGRSLRLTSPPLSLPTSPRTGSIREPSSMRAHWSRMEATQGLDIRSQAHRACKFGGMLLQDRFNSPS